MGLALAVPLLFLFLVSLSSPNLYIVYCTPSSHLGFTLTHRDAETSPLRSLHADPADLPEDMPLRAFVAAGRALRARLYMQRKLLKPNLPLAGRLSYGREMVGDFFLTVPVGTPSQNLVFLVDTGSEFSWSQCSPCLNCTITPAPRFFHNQSSSFRAVGCDSYLCLNSVGLLQLPSCEDERALCSFAVAYGDGTFSLGIFSIDSFALGPGFSKPFVFGCASTVQETFPFPSSGLMGLNAGAFSFTSQLFSSSPSMPKQFAYCLPDRMKGLNAAGSIVFGNYNRPRGIRYTPFAPPYSPLGSVYYYVELQGITVGESLIKVDMEGAERLKGGGTIFDSGSAVTSLVKPLYDRMVGEMRRQTAHLGPFNASATELEWDLCYKVAANTTEPPKVPKISMHFAGGVDIELGAGSVLLAAQIRGDHTSIYFCFAFQGALADINRLNIIGNYQQQDYWVEYNLATSSLGLAKTKCAHYN